MTASTIEDPAPVAIDMALVEREERLIRDQGALARLRADQDRRAAALTASEQGLESLHQDLLKRQEAILAQGTAVAERENALTREEGALNNRRQELDTRAASLKALYDTLQRRHQDLVSREEAVHKAELERDDGFVEQRRSAMADLDRLIQQERDQRLSAVAIEAVAQRASHDRAIQQSLDDQERVRMDFSERARAAEIKLLSREDALIGREAALRVREREVEAKLSRVDDGWDRLEDEVENRLSEEKLRYENSEKRAKDECGRLRAALAVMETENTAFKRLRQTLGEDPRELIQKLDDARQDAADLRETLARRPPEELREIHATLKAELESIRSQNNEMEGERLEFLKQLQNQNVLLGDKIFLEDQLEQAKRENKILNDAKARLTDEMKRLNAAYERSADRDTRVRDLEDPYFPQSHNGNFLKPVSEIAWLNDIETACRDHGLRFQRRILHAFHTAIKTAEWSPLTVLAGVSGTGKSELPRLYSHFGGLKFLNMAVQPNWDSQEAMLGFFNSIDNRFDAQPLLRMLAQSQKMADPIYPGLKEAMVLVLLDEMNLAHVELYFAEFLSKLESRRSTGHADVPRLEVKLGSGIEPYRLPLGRNVLWTGTMNQDETTKALSDKVIDRGFIIHFPSPLTFERRVELKPLPPEKDVKLLHYQTWNEWRVLKTTFSDDDIQPYKTMVEKINAALSAAGRSLGHRVWQSMEYYMANYPDVIQARKDGDDDNRKAAMRMAFEDQLVLKIMPKLRGIDTRGRSKTDCLDRIRELIKEGEYSILDDFNRACDMGYGQFIWNSADYLRIEVEPEPVK